MVSVTITRKHYYNHTHIYIAPLGGGFRSANYAFYLAQNRLNLEMTYVAVWRSRGGAETAAASACQRSTGTSL